MKKFWLSPLIFLMISLLAGCIETVSWSPDGNWLAYVSSRSGHPQLWISNVKGTQHIKLTTFSKDETPLFPQWMPQGDKILFVQSDEKSKKYALMLLNKNKKTKQLLVRFDDGGFFSSSSVLAAGSIIFFSKHNKVYSLDTETGAKREVYKKTGCTPSVYAVSSSGKYLLVGMSKEKTKPDALDAPEIFNIVDTGTGAVIDIPRKPDEIFLIQKFVPDGDKLFYLVKKQSGKIPSYKGITIDIQTGGKSGKNGVPVSLEIDSTTTAWEGNAALRFLKNNLVLDLNIEDGSVRVVKEIYPQDNWKPASFSPDGKKLAFFYPLAQNTGKDIMGMSDRYVLVVVYDIFSGHAVIFKDKAENNFLYCKNLNASADRKTVKSCFQSFMKTYPHLSALRDEAKYLN